MARRAAAGFGRLLPMLLISTAAVVVVSTALLAACGGSSGGVTPPASTTAATRTPATPATTSASPSPSASPAEMTISLYFLRGEKLGVAERRIPRTTMPATAAMKALLAGPTSEEKAAGLGTAIPAGTTLQGLSISAGTASVGLSSAFGSGGGSLSMTARVAEVVYTLTRFPTVRAVQFLMDGKPVEALGGEGVVLSDPQRRADWRDFEPNIFVESPGVGAVLSNPFRISGTASVFEGSFIAKLVDNSGRRIVSTPVQASMGAPGRGRFSKVIPFSTSAKRGVLIVYDESMKDGSKLDEVKIPVTFAD